MFFKDRSKRIEKIAASAAPHLESDEEVEELVQVQSGRSADANAAAVSKAFHRFRYDPGAEAAVKSFAVLATDRNLYLVTLTGIRLLDVGEVIFKEPLAESRAIVEDKFITINGVRLHVMNFFESHVAGLRDLLGAARDGA